MVVLKLRCIDYNITVEEGQESPPITKCFEFKAGRKDGL